MSYLTLDHKKRKRYIAATVKALKNSGLEFRSIVCTGLSGMMIAPVVAERLGARLVIVRKDESSHGSDIETSGIIGSYIILDDFIETGATLDRVIEKINDNGYLMGECVGAFLYRQDSKYRVTEYKERNPDLWVEYNKTRNG